MNEWKSLLHADPTNWLLEENNPSVRYYTLKTLLDKPDDDKDVQRAKRTIMETGLVPRHPSKAKRAGVFACLFEILYQ